MPRTSKSKSPDPVIELRKANRLLAQSAVALQRLAGDDIEAAGLIVQISESRKAREAATKRPVAPEDKIGK